MERINYISVFFLVLGLSVTASAQEKDSLQTRQLREVVIQSKRLTDVDRLPPVQGIHLYVSLAARLGQGSW